MSISIILPSYKEYDNLKIILPELENELNSFISDYEILVIDTIEAMDETPTLCKKCHGAIDIVLLLAIIFLILSLIVI